MTVNVSWKPMPAEYRKSAERYVTKYLHIVPSWCHRITVSYKPEPGDDVEDAGVAIDGLSIAADGHYTTRQGEAVYSQGTVEMRGDSLIFTALPEQERTRDAWRLEHGDLVLTRRTSRDFASTPGVVVVPAEQVLRFERD